MAAVGADEEEEKESGCEVTGCGAMANRLATASNRSNAATGIVSLTASIRVRE